jgi:Icc-related predicted phosphoesterase
MERTRVRIVAVADLHGWLPAEVPACDLLIIAGDICPDGDRQFQWLDAELRPWLEAVPARYVVATWGNHDYAAEWGYVPPLPCAFLVDEGIDIEGVAVYGTPWTREAGMWAFSEPEAVLAGTFARIPDGVDIVISHSPPLGWCDRTPEGTYRGSAALLDAMERARPRLTICGHAHDGRGGADAPWGRIENVSAVDGRRRRRRSPFVVIDWPGATAGETRAATSDGIDGSWPGTAVAS